MMKCLPGAGEIPSIDLQTCQSHCPADLLRLHEQSFLQYLNRFIRPCGFKQEPDQHLSGC